MQQPIKANSQPHPYPMLTPDQVIAVRNKIVALKTMQSALIITDENKAQTLITQREVGHFLSDPEVVLEFIGSWLACNGEYAPVIRALVPMINRVNQVIQENANAQAAAQGIAPAADGKS